MRYIFFTLMFIIACAPTQKLEIPSIELEVISIAFDNMERIPIRYTCLGDNINPPLRIEGIPDNVKSLALIIDDENAPGGTWAHWVVWNIPTSTDINEDSVPGIQGVNSWGRNDYEGPCPPMGTHRYVFMVYALDTMLDMPQTSDKDALKEAIYGHIVAYGELVGKYSKN